MRAIPIAQTMELPEGMMQVAEWEAPEEDGWTWGEMLLEFAGRLCYLSFDRPNALTRKIYDYLANIRSQGHFSVYEHTVVSFYFDGISRNCGYEMLRHRHFSRSELSQRFVNMDESVVVFPPAMRDNDSGGVLIDVRNFAREAYSAIVENLTDEGLHRKQVREAARSVLPGMTETRFVQTGNLRAWRHFLTMRGNIHADAEIRAVAVAVAGELVRMYPNAMADIEFYSEDGHACVRLKQSDAE